MSYINHRRRYLLLPKKYIFFSPIYVFRTGKYIFLCLIYINGDVVHAGVWLPTFAPRRKNRKLGAMNYLPDAGLFLLFFASLLAFGVCLTAPTQPLLHLVFPALGFLGGWATLFYGVGWAGAMLPLRFWIIGVAVLLAGIVWKRGTGAANWRKMRGSLRALSLMERVLAVYLVGMGALFFVLSLAPPSGNDYDSLVYHLAVPAQWLRVGRIGELRYDHHSYFPLVGEMLYALGLGVRGPVLAKLFHWGMFVLGAGVLAQMGRRAGGRAAGLWASALYVSLPMAGAEVTTAYVDLTFSAFAWAAIALFGEAIYANEEGNQRTSWLGCGAFCGFCIGSKYLGWLVFGFLGLWLLSQVARRRVKVAALAQLTIPCLLLGGGWYLRNWAWTGNPVFPFAYGIFGGRGWTLQMAHDYDASQAIYGFGHSPLDLVMLPWRLAMTPLGNLVLGSPPKGLSFWPLDNVIIPADIHTGFFEVPGLAAFIFPGPVLLALGVPAFLARRKGAYVGFLAWLFAFLWLFWAFTSQQVRYLFPALGVLCVLSGWVLCTRLTRFRIASLLAFAGAGAWLLFAPVLALKQAKGSLSVISGGETPDHYLRRTVAGYDAMSWINQNTPPQSHFAVWGEPRDFYLQRTFFWADAPHNLLIPYATISKPEQLAAALKGLGATHVLINRVPGKNGGFGGPPPQFDAMVSGGQAHLIFPLNGESGHGYEVYALD